MVEMSLRKEENHVWEFCYAKSVEEYLEDILIVHRDVQLVPANQVNRRKN